MVLPSIAITLFAPSIPELFSAIRTNLNSNCSLSWEQAKAVLLRDRQNAPKIARRAFKLALEGTTIRDAARIRSAVFFWKRLQRALRKFAKKKNGKKPIELCIENAEAQKTISGLGGRSQWKERNKKEKQDLSRLVSWTHRPLYRPSAPQKYWAKTVTAQRSEQAWFLTLLNFGSERDKREAAAELWHLGLNDFFGLG